MFQKTQTVYCCELCYKPFINTEECVQHEEVCKTIFHDKGTCNYVRKNEYRLINSTCLDDMVNNIETMLNNVLDTYLIITLPRTIRRINLLDNVIGVDNFFGCRPNTQGLDEHRIEKFDNDSVLEFNVKINPHHKSNKIIVDHDMITRMVLLFSPNAFLSFKRMVLKRISNTNNEFSCIIKTECYPYIQKEINRLKMKYGEQYKNHLDDLIYPP